MSLNKKPCVSGAFNRHHEGKCQLKKRLYNYYLSFYARVFIKRSKYRTDVTCQAKLHTESP